ncbi:hypothetical protein AC482_00685 [miscellaneous Crenarchaeota group-15 archaeon DG-45]|uniref:Yip1 domain-containing protein n=1 Tax=miscellaneous Crenarchaeota group-15 archaeon DG-45 TaxID=1685127 RepID=A0A0M0BSZ5_9ARCH|nr:MAG: hypothetical protein AC482_00685 [miscellaneous Crenarchaeota group-15 archaeon DG-45]
MSEAGRGFLSKVWGSLTSPRGTMESIRGEDLRKGAILILALAAISAWAGYVYASKLPFALPAASQYSGFGQVPSPAAVRRSLMTIFAFRDGVGAVVIWLVPSLLLHLLMSLRGGGSLSRMLALRGFASTPLLLQQVLRLVDAYIVSEEALLRVTVAQAAGQGMAFQLLRGASFVLNIFGLWAFVLTLMAASVNYKASAAKAAVATAAAYLAFVLLRLILPI